MRVHVVDPSAYTPPYDHALCCALAKAGAQVELFTSRFAYGSVPAPDGYVRHEHFYRHAHRGAASGRRGRVALAGKLVEHVPDMLRYRRAARAADVVHFQWFTVQPADLHLLPRDVPLVLTAHDVLPREPRMGQLRAQRRLYQRMDAIVVHSERGRQRLTHALGLDPARVRVIPHGVLRPAAQPCPPAGGANAALPPDLARVKGPVVLFFGLLRPYKGLDVLLEAWRGVPAAELWVVGMPRMDLRTLRAAAPAGVRFHAEFVPEAVVEGLLRRASLLVLPYREIDQSGVALTALGTGTPMILSDVGGFAELARHGCARLVPPGDSAALHAALCDLLSDAPARAQMSAQALLAAEGPFSWSSIATRTLSLYEALLDG